MSLPLVALHTKKNISIFSLGILIIIIATISFSLGAYFEKDKYADFVDSFRTVRENSDKYTFINPLIGGISAPSTDVGIYSDIRDQINSYLNSEIRKKSLYSYSFYFRDMNTGFWFGINENGNFSPSSLFKLPVAIAVYKQVENDPSFLKKQLIYTKEISDVNVTKQLNAESTLVVGQQYSVNQLVEKMLTLSDNGAKNLLLSAIDKKYLDQLLKLVNFSNTVDTTTYDISSQKYANFLRILYGSSYVNEEHSEFILYLLAHSTFKDGIVAGLPTDVQVAHKFGVYEFPEKVDGKDVLTVQLHDCGVVYYGTNPYVFCLMTKGKDDDSLFRVISSVSKMTYEHQVLHHEEGIH